MPSFARVGFAVGAIVLAVAMPGGCRRGLGGEGAPGAVVAGRMLDPDGVRPEGVALRVGQPYGADSRSLHMIRPAADGTFVTPPLRPGPYVLELVRTREAATNGRVIGFQTVRVGSSDVTGITIDVRRDTALAGRFRMLSDNPQAEWPVHMGVVAYSALEGAGTLTRFEADGGPGGTFVLRNAFGPRILRSYYRNPPASRWWLLRVELNGQDVTNVPTDFSKYPDGRLEILLTQHPARISGTVVDSHGQPVPRPWVSVVGTDRGASQRWATTAVAADGDAFGRFSIEVPPGVYRVNAFPHASYPHLSAVHERMSRTPERAEIVSVAERQTVDVGLQASEAAAASP